MSENQSRVQQLAQKSYARNDPTGWFEELYSGAQGNESAIPWAKSTVNPNLASWIKQQKLRGDGKTALVVGCGLGDDAEAIAELGYQVSAFDISPTAIAWCQKRFANSKVNYLIDDLLQPQKVNACQYDFILESYTLQALPAKVRPLGMKTISQLLKERGRLLVICRGRDANQPAEELPFPLTQEELTYFEDLGLKLVKFEDYVQPKDSSIKRFRIEYTK